MNCKKYFEDLERKDYLTVLLISSLFLFLALSAAYSNPAYIDEPTHISAGYTNLKLGDYRMHTEAPPVIHMISASPLLFTDLNTFEESKYWQEKDMVNYSCMFLRHNELSDQKIMFLSRIPTILMALFLGLFIFFLVKHFYDKNTALLVYFLYALHPIILTHSSITYIDFGFLFFNFFTFFSLLKFIDTKKEKYLYAFFILFSLTFLTKFTAVHNFIFYPLILALNYNHLKNWFIKNKNNMVKYLVIAGAIFYITILVLYMFQGLFMPLKQAMTDDPFIDKSDHKYESALQLFDRNAITRFGTSIPNPFPYYLSKGIGYWIFDNRSGVGGFNLGITLKNLLLSNTLPILILLLAHFVLWKNNRGTKKKGFNYELNYVYYITFFLIMFGVLGSYVYPRYTLMVYPFLILLTAKPISYLFNSSIQKKYKVAIVLGIILLHAVPVLLHYPAFKDYDSILYLLFGRTIEDLPLHHLMNPC